MRPELPPFRLTAVALGLAVLAGTSMPARAGPDKCAVVSLTATCEGNQSTGLRAPNDFPIGITRIVVRNLNAPISTSGASGIKNVHTGALTSASIEFFGDRYALTSSG